MPHNDSALLGYGMVFLMDYNSFSINLLQNYSHVKSDNKRLVSQLSSGNRIVNGAVDPSGLAISKGMQSQVRGLSVSLQNAQETLKLMRLADGALDTITSLVLRMRDLAIRMANEATANTVASTNPGTMIPSSQRTMYNEMGTLAEEVRRETGGMMLPNPPFIIEESSVKYNNKDLFFAGFDSGQASQIGPNNSSGNSFSVVIPSMVDIADSFPTPATPMPGTFTASDFMDFARIQMDELSADLEKISNTRALLGAQANALEKIVNDININFINMTEADSKISGVDVEQAISDLKQNIITQSTLGTAMSSFMDMRKLDLEILNVLPIYMQGKDKDKE